MRTSKIREGEGSLKDNYCLRAGHRAVEEFLSYQGKSVCVYIYISIYKYIDTFTYICIKHYIYCVVKKCNSNRKKRKTNIVTASSFWVD